MGKKTDTKLPSAIARRAAKPVPSAEQIVQPVPAVKPRAAAVSTVPVTVLTARKKAAKPAAKTTKSRRAKPAYSRDDVALRAYFIAEKRQASGIYGNPDSDWVEAERQLAAEATKKAKAKPKAR